MNTDILLRYLKLGLLLSFFFLFACDWSHDKSRINKETLNEMIEKANVSIPNSYKELEVYDEMEYGLIAMFKTDSISVERIIKDNGLIPISREKIDLLFLCEIDKNWTNKSKKMDGYYNHKLANNQYYNLKDCKEPFIWNILLHKKSKKIWFELLYPDNSGDYTLCKEVEVRKASDWNGNVPNAGIKK